MEKTADNIQYLYALKLLSDCLKEAYNKNVIILIDEYDVPLESAYFGGFYDEMVNLIRSVFESALKTNPSLEFGILTGCLRISKESIFTGLNNLKVNSSDARNNENVLPKPYWSNTSSNDIIHQLINEGDEETREQIEDRNYEAELVDECYQNIVKYGVAFYQKSRRIKKA